MSHAQPIAVTQPIHAELLHPAMAADRFGGHWHGPERIVRVAGAAIDSREVVPGCLFACLQGERVDGHDFAATAVGAGAVVLLATRPLEVPAPTIVVPDVAAALRRWAAWIRTRLDHLTWLAVCGANGKTTTKELLAAALRGAGQVVHATSGNRNNLLGVPLTLLNTPAAARYAVVELGTNHPGEVRQLTELVRPDHALVTSIGPEHLEGLGDLRGVVREECSVARELPSSAPGQPRRLRSPLAIGLAGIAVQARSFATTPAALLTEAEATAGGPVLAFDDPAESTGLGQPVRGQCGAHGIRLDTLHGSAAMPLLGSHNLVNAALAFHLACAAGIAPGKALKGLSATTPVTGRLAPITAGPHLLLDDTYNANPASMIAGLEVLAQMPGAKLAILGAMGELGTTTDAGHARVGAAAARLGIPLLVVAARNGLGGTDTMLAAYRAAGGGDGVLAATREEAIAAARQRLATAHTVLVKASRSQGLETIVSALQQSA